MGQPPPTPTTNFRQLPRSQVDPPRSSVKTLRRRHERRLNTINEKDTDERGFSRILIRVHPCKSVSYFSKESCVCFAVLKGDFTRIVAPLGRGAHLQGDNYEPFTTRKHHKETPKSTLAVANLALAPDLRPGRIDHPSHHRPAHPPTWSGRTARDAHPFADG